MVSVAFIEIRACRSSRKPKNRSKLTIFWRTSLLFCLWRACQLLETLFRRDRRPPHRPGVCGVPHRGGRTGAGAGGPHHSGQSVGAQESGGSRFSGDASERTFPLHADVFVVAESSRDLVFQGRARRDCSRNLYQREGSGPQASPLYQRLLSER